jgi:signal transduction histidine kinase
MWELPVLLCIVLASGLGLRRWPLAALGVLVAGSLGVVLGGSVATTVLRSGPVIAGLLVVICAAGLEICYLAATRTRRVWLAGLAMVGVSLLAGVLAVPHTESALVPYGGVGQTQGEVIAAIAVVLVTVIGWLIGYSVRQAHDRAELVRAQAAAQTALAERLRIARELHDMVAHSIGIIAIQAGAGHRVFDASPAEARDALAAIEATSRETLSGLRRMVTGLRRAETESGQAPSGSAPVVPAPGGDGGREPPMREAGLADLERLAAATQEAGVRVDVDWQGARAPLPADLDLAAFRIIQEAVTNVVHHAGTDQCRVSIGQQDGQLSIEVTDRGRGGDPSGTGFGIIGMRERAELLGGDFTAGPRPEGGFRVAARLPVPAAAR